MAVALARRRNSSSEPRILDQAPSRLPHGVLPIFHPGLRLDLIAIKNDLDGGFFNAFTRTHMQDEVLRLWQTRRTTMLLVTHDIDEAIYMSDRIIIMTPRPGRIEQTIPITLDRPRQRNRPEFLRLRSDILELLHFAGDAKSTI